MCKLNVNVLLCLCTVPVPVRVIVKTGLQVPVRYLSTCTGHRYFCTVCCVFAMLFFVHGGSYRYLYPNCYRYCRLPCATCMYILHILSIHAMIRVYLYIHEVHMCTSFVNDTCLLGFSFQRSMVALAMLFLSSVLRFAGHLMVADIFRTLSIFF